MKLTTQSFGGLNTKERVNKFKAITNKGLSQNRKNRSITMSPNASDLQFIA
tara:strand:+ start:174 stop:326 length:153 start_codon:yes stop_codon:yes gene_type:complete